MTSCSCPPCARTSSSGPGTSGLTGMELEHRVSTALAALEVADLADRAPNHLSFGQKRRVSMAGVMAMEPEILVLDEPTSNLDPASRQDLTRALLGLDVTQLIVTHDLLYALEVCPRSVIIDAGQNRRRRSDQRAARRPRSAWRRIGSPCPRPWVC